MEKGKKGAEDRGKTKELSSRKTPNLAVVVKYSNDRRYHYWLMMDGQHMMTVINGTMFYIGERLYTVNIIEGMVSIQRENADPGLKIKRPQLLDSVMEFSFDL